MKLVATDIDGTILPHGGEISARTAETLRAVADAGVPVVLVTARPPRWMRTVVDALGHTGEAIIANGAAVMDLDSGDVYQGEYEGWYDAGQEEYVTESNAQQHDYRSVVNGKPLVRSPRHRRFLLKHRRTCRKSASSKWTEAGFARVKTTVHAV